MTGPDLSSEAIEFLRRDTPTAELLDVLMTLSAEPTREWTVVEISNAIYSVPQSVEQRLDELAHRGLAERLPGSPVKARLAVVSPMRHAIISELFVAYRRNRAQVAQLLLHVSRNSLATFADAFRFRKE